MKTLASLLALCFLVACQTSTSDTTDELEAIGDPVDPGGDEVEPEPDPTIDDEIAGDVTCDAGEEPPPFDGCDESDDAASCGTGQSPSGQQRKPPPGYSTMTRDQQCFQEPGFTYTSNWYGGVASDGWCEACGGSPTGSAWSHWNTGGDKVCAGTGVSLTGHEQKCVCTPVQMTAAGLFLPAVIAQAYLMNYIRVALIRGTTFAPIVAIEAAIKKAIKGFGLSLLKCQELATYLCTENVPAGNARKQCLETAFLICNTCRTQ